MSKQQDEASAEETFTIEAQARKGGKTVAVQIVLPKFEDVITFGLGRTLRHLPPEEQIYKMVEAVLDETQIAALDSLGPVEAARVLQAWQEDSGITLGESEASST